MQAPERLYWGLAATLAKHGYVVLTYDVQGQGLSDVFGQGADQTAWLRLLARNRLAVEPSHWYIAAIASMVTVGNMALRWIQDNLHGGNALGWARSNGHGELADILP